MFKNGQLVKTAYGFGVVGKESVAYPGSYIIRYIRRGGLNSSVYYEANGLKLIGNNFKFKGVK
nr:MAG: hypothetical protein [Bacteriophage sp.]UVX44249.1 MAG: hypothetical protein [Bacteriophage sp.]